MAVEKNQGKREYSFYPESIVLDEEKFTLLLNTDGAVIDFNNMSDVAEKHGFDKKTEFHITVVGFKNGVAVKRALDKFPEDVKQKKIQEIRSLVAGITWGFALLPRRYHMTKEYTFRTGSTTSTEHRESYIQMASVPDMAKFYDALNNILDTHLTSPPPHLTLYTSGDDRERAKAGISINSQEEFLRLNPRPLN